MGHGCDTHMRALARVEEALNRVVLGQSRLIRLFLTGVLAGGHILLEGLPGTGKTQMVRAFCALVGMRSARIQFTPDLMPLDITGSNLLREDCGRREFEFSPGPVFANMIIADEINRASPKTQAALLEAMQERQVTVLGATHALPEPFAVLATQNPIELEGTYPLPEAQLDRFLFKLDVGAVGLDELRDIASGKAGGALPDLRPELSLGEFVEASRVAMTARLSSAVADYIARLVLATRPGAGGASARVKFGASPRAALGLAAAAKALAFLDGRLTVGFEDVKVVAPPILRHRLVLDYQAKLEGTTADAVVERIVASTRELSRGEPSSLAARIAGGGVEMEAR